MPREVPWGKPVCIGRSPSHPLHLQSLLRPGCGTNSMTISRSTAWHPITSFGSADEIQLSVGVAQKSALILRDLVCRELLGIGVTEA